MTRSQATLRFSCLLLAFTGCTVVGGSSEEFQPPHGPTRLVTPEDVATRTITSRGIESHVSFLASDAMRGRATPSRELDRAAAWIAARFQTAGLEPAGDDGGFIQYWPFERVTLDTERAAVSWAGAAASRSGSLEYGRDFAALPAARGGEGRLVYLGPADLAPDSMAAAAGAVAVVLLAGSDPAAWRWPITVRRSMLTAARAGAHGVVFVLDPAFDADAIAGIARQFETPVETAQQVPLFFVRQAAVAAMLDATDESLSSLIHRTNAGDLRPVRLGGAAFRVGAPTAPVAVPAPNVVARMSGSDPDRADEYIILIAHFDHIGVGAPDETGDSIYSGADDNASGTAALIEVARAFAALPMPPARPILFVALSGEELGLLGSTWFTRNPTVFLSDAVAVLNMDMVGRNHPDTVQVIGFGYSSLGPLLDTVARESPRLGLHVVPDRMPEEGFFRRSDHFPFAQRGIPAVLVFSGIHDDYHQPSDRIERVDADKTARIARLVFLTAYRLAAGDYRPAWTEEGRAAVRR